MTEQDKSLLEIQTLDDTEPGTISEVEYFTLLADTAKFIGNSIYGKTITNEEKRKLKVESFTLLAAKLIGNPVYGKTITNEEKHKNIGNVDGDKSMLERGKQSQHHEAKGN